MVIAILYCQFQSDAFYSGRFFKRSNLLAQLFSSIHFRNSQAQFIGLQLVEVEHLVYQPQHSVHTHTYMNQDTVYRLRQGFIGIQRHQRSGYDSKRITEFVSNIGKEPHIHLLSLLFAFQFALLLQKQKMIGASPKIERVEIKENTKKDAEIKQPSCRWPPGSMHNRNLYLALSQSRLVGRWYEAQTESIRSRRKIGITGLTAVCRNLPVSIIAFEFVLTHQRRATAEVGIIEIELQIVLIVSKSIAVQMSYLIGNGKHLAISLRHFYTINRQHLAGMNARLSIQEVGLHRLRRHELAAVRTTQH